MLKVILETSCGLGKAHILRFAFQTRRLYGTVVSLEMSEKGIFAVHAAKVIDANSNARLGELAIKERSVIRTPNFLAVASRGVVPHITPDVLSEHTVIGGVHMALEDCKFHAL